MTVFRNTFEVSIWKDQDVLQEYISYFYVCLGVCIQLYTSRFLYLFTQETEVGCSTYMKSSTNGV